MLSRPADRAAKSSTSTTPAPTSRKRPLPVRAKIICCWLAPLVLNVPSKVARPSTASIPAILPRASRNSNSSSSTARRARGTVPEISCPLRSSLPPIKPPARRVTSSVPLSRARASSAPSISQLPIARVWEDSLTEASKLFRAPRSRGSRDHSPGTDSPPLTGTSKARIASAAMGPVVRSTANLGRTPSRARDRLPSTDEPPRLALRLSADMARASPFKRALTASGPLISLVGACKPKPPIKPARSGWSSSVASVTLRSPGNPSRRPFVATSPPARPSFAATSKPASAPFAEPLRVTGVAKARGAPLSSTSAERSRRARSGWENSPSRSMRGVPASSSRRPEILTSASDKDVRRSTSKSDAIPSNLASTTTGAANSGGTSPVSSPTASSNRPTLSLLNVASPSNDGSTITLDNVPSISTRLSKASSVPSTTNASSPPASRASTVRAPAKAGGRPASSGTTRVMAERSAVSNCKPRSTIGSAAMFATLPVTLALAPARSPTPTSRKVRLPDCNRPSSRKPLMGSSRQVRLSA